MRMSKVLKSCPVYCLFSVVLVLMVALTSLPVMVPSVSAQTVDEKDIKKNSPPVAGSDYYEVDRGGMLIIEAPGLLANDSDKNGDALKAIKVTDPFNGTLSLNENGSFAYFHNGSDIPSDSFSYMASDGIQNSAPVTVTITVTSINNPPETENDYRKPTYDTYKK